MVKKKAKKQKKTKKLKSKIKEDVDEVKKSEEIKEEKKINFLKDRYDSLKEQITEFRKHGKDTKIVEIKLIELKQKINFFEAVQEIKDYEKANEIIKYIEKEIKDIEQKPIKKDLGKEIREIINQLEETVRGKDTEEKENIKSEPKKKNKLKKVKKKK